MSQTNEDCTNTELLEKIRLSKNEAFEMYDLGYKSGIATALRHLHDLEEILIKYYKQ